ncbi:OB-fold nucleic acid binding domain-containing protein [Brevibacterium ihuae]|uniref:OB-fold nucleic acid binding domain-containing protein n=1 Tax=Brevibacterium ihuae TaxID=1631743 RepID=UPI000C778B8A|nr:OB-fold nucleic acid binding domain-containing protein [Brevibacterium ihuae]
MSALGRLLDRFGSKDVEADEDIHAASAVPDAIPLAELPLREATRVAGVVVAVTRSLPHESPRLDIVISDGTGSAAARFLGRREIPGVAAGRVIVLEGRFCAQDGGARTVNPAYRLIGSAAE